MSGHNRWSKIKHKKEASDSKKSKLWTKVIKELTISARLGGGDINGNPRLRAAVDKARTVNMPNDTIDRAIKKGTGDLEGVTYEEFSYEVFGPGGTAVLVERFDPTEALDIVEQQGVTMLPGAPPMFVQWLEQPQGRKKAFGSVRMAVSGAAPLAPDTFQRFKDRFNVTIWDSYGLTEAGPAVTSNAVGERARAGSIGLPIPDLTVRLVEQGAGATPPNESLSSRTTPEAECSL